MLFKKETLFLNSFFFMLKFIFDVYFMFIFRTLQNQDFKLYAEIPQQKHSYIDFIEIKHSLIKLNQTKGQVKCYIHFICIICVVYIYIYSLYTIYLYLYTIYLFFVQTTIFFFFVMML